MSISENKGKKEGEPLQQEDVAQTSQSHQSRPWGARLRDTSVRYRQTLALDRVSLAIHPGEVLALLGTNGAGKTTLMRVLCGLLPPSDGRIEFAGAARGSAAIRSLVGWCPQDMVLWNDMTCLEQLSLMGSLYGLSRRASKTRAMELLEELGLHNRQRSLAGTLSGGMKRRLSIAMALMHDPVLLVLDEPEVGLDPQSRTHLRAYLQQLTARGKAILLSTHGLGEVEKTAARIAILHRGQLLICDTRDRLLAQQDTCLTLVFAPDAQGAGPSRKTAVFDALAPWSASLSWSQNEAVLRSPEALALLPKVASALACAGVEPRRLALRQASLEDVFLTWTGQEAGL